MRRPIHALGLLMTMMALFTPTAAMARDEPSFDRKEDVIYARKFGTALTLDVFTPRKGANGAAVVLMVSGGFFSSKEAINPNNLIPSSIEGTRSSPWSTAASPGSRSRRSSRTSIGRSATSATTPRTTRSTRVGSA